MIPARRDFLQLLALAAATGSGLGRREAHAATADRLYDLPPFGNVALMHFTDCHAQLLPIVFREADINLGAGESAGRVPHLSGEALLRAFGIAPGSARAHAFSCVDFEAAARRFGKAGGFAHLATLVQRVRAGRPHALLLDGGDTWQGSATALWTAGQDMVDACRLLGVDMMSAHWEFTLGAQRVQEIVANDLRGRTAFLAQNVRTADFGDPVFEPVALRVLNGVPVAVIGQAYPYTPIAHPRRFMPDWSFGIEEASLQAQVDAARAGGAQAVVLLSHNGMGIDLKLASRVTGIDAILGGHTHDAVPAPVVVHNRRGQTLVTNAGSNGKFLGVLDLDVRHGRVQDFRYRLMPVFSNLLPANAAMQSHIDRVRAPHADRLGETLTISEGALHRRGNFGGSWDQVIVDALTAVLDAEIAFSPGFRWGTSLLPGEAVNREAMMNQLAITYPQTTVLELRGDTLKSVLEDVCDNLFDPDPYRQQGGDMLRVGGLHYACTPGERAGSRISDMRLNGRAIEADKTYRVAGWAPLADDATGTPVWDIVEEYLRSRPRLAPPRLNRPRLLGVAGDAGIALECTSDDRPLHPKSQEAS